MREFVVFKIKNELYAIDIMKVNSIIEYKEPNKIPNTPDYVQGVINLRGTIVPIMDLREMLGYKDNVNNEAETKIIIVEKDEESIGLIIDEVKSVRKIDDEQIDKIEKIGVENYNSAVKAIAKDENNENEKLIAIIDIDTLIKNSEISQ